MDKVTIGESGGEREQKETHIRAGPSTSNACSNLEDRLMQNGCRALLNSCYKSFYLVADGIHSKL